MPKIVKEERKTEFLIVRVTKREKNILLYECSKNFKNISKLIRLKLGFDKPKEIPVL